MDFVVTVSKDFLTDKSPDCEMQQPSFFSNNVSHSNQYASVICDLYKAARSPEYSEARLTRLGFGECIRAYETLIQSKWSNVVAALNLTRRNFTDGEMKSSDYVHPFVIRYVTSGSETTWISNETAYSSNFVSSNTLPPLDTCTFDPTRYLHRINHLLIPSKLRSSTVV